MEYQKFNCYDLAMQNTELHGVHRKMLNLSEELTRVTNQLDPQIRSYESLSNQCISAGAAIDDISTRILNAHNALDQIVDLYYAAEVEVAQSVEALPTGIAQKESARSYSSALKLQSSSISGGDLVVEDWLAELVYRSGN